jgi:hypothetical protein
LLLSYLLSWTVSCGSSDTSRSKLRPGCTRFNVRKQNDTHLSISSKENLFLENPNKHELATINTVSKFQNY